MRRHWVWLVVLATLCLDLSFLSNDYVFEGLARAMPIELNRFRHLFGGNYLLYGPLGWCFHHLLQLLGIQQLAVTSLQMMDACIGAAGIGVYFLALRRMGITTFLTVSGALLLASCLGYWMWSTDAENYIFSTFLLILNFYFLIRYAEGDSVSPLTLGALEALALLGHLVNGLFLIVTLWIIFSSHRPRSKRFVLLYFGSALGLIFLAYALVLGIIERPSSVGAALDWIAGSASTGHLQLSLGGPFRLSGVGQWLKMTLHIITSFVPSYKSPAPWAAARYALWGARLLLAIMIIAGLFHARALSAKKRVIAGACGVWLLSYAAMFTRWQPFTMVYRVSDLVPICTLLIIGIDEAQKRFPAARWGMAALVIFLLIGNGGAELYPRHSLTNNLLLQRMLFFNAHTPENAWIGGGNIEELYVPYFAARRPIVVDRYRAQPEGLQAFLRNLVKNKQPVYMPSTVLDDPVWSTLLTPFQWEAVARDATGVRLYHLVHLKTT